jgi:putative endonuclease
MAKTKKREIGDIGERVACKYLELKGFRIVERNYLRKWGEIDIVAEKLGILRFVEVKTVSREMGSRGTGESYFRPEDNVHPAKIKRLHRAIQTYLIDNKIGEQKEWCLDVVCVYLNQTTRKAHVEMLENVIL